MTPNVTYYAALPTSEEGAREAAGDAGWSYDEKLSQVVPPHLQVISIQQALDDPSELSQAGEDIQQQLAAALDTKPAAIAARVGGPKGMNLGSSKPRSQWEVNLLPSELGPGVLTSIVDGVFRPARDPTGGGAKSAGAASDGTSAEEAKSGGGDPTAPTGAPVPPAAAAISAAIPALLDPSKLWDFLEGDERGAVAKARIEALYADRSRISRRSEWIFSPEMTLIEASPEDERQRLAKELLLVRGQLTAADAKSRDSRAELLAKEVELAAKRVELAEKGVGLAGEMLSQLKKWRAIANLGLVVLCVTTGFSMLAVGYLLTYLIPGGKIGEVAAPIVIFALALFAISPAVLLLRERPLEGIDKWSPSGGSDGKAESATGASSASTEGEGTGSKDSIASAKPAAPTPPTGGS